MIQTLVNAKWISYEDDLFPMVYTIEGFELYNNGIVARIFKERINNSVTMKKEYRYFPQIDHERNESVIIIGDERLGYKGLKEAKNALIYELNKYLEDN